MVKKLRLSTNESYDKGVHSKYDSWLDDDAVDYLIKLGYTLKKPDGGDWYFAKKYDNGIKVAIFDETGFFSIVLKDGQPIDEREEFNGELNSVESLQDIKTLDTYVSNYYKAHESAKRNKSLRITEARQTTDSLIKAIKANAESILRNLDDIENGKANLDDYNEGLLRKAKTEIINTNSKLSTVAGYVRR